MDNDHNLLISGILMAGAILFFIALSLDFFKQLGDRGKTDGLL